MLIYYFVKYYTYNIKRIGMYMMSLLAEGGGGVASDIKSCTRNYKELKLFIIYFYLQH